MPRSAEAYVAACPQITDFDGDWGDTLDGPWSENDEVSDWLAASRQGLGKFRMAAGKRECFFLLEAPDSTGDPRMDSCLLFAGLPWAKPYRDATKGLIAQGYRAWAKGDQTLLPGNCITVLRSAHHLDNSPTLIWRIVGMDCATRSYRALRRAFELCEDPVSLAAQVLPELQAAHPAPPPFTEVCSFERILYWDLCQRLYVAGKEQGTWLVPTQDHNLLRDAGVSGFSDAELKRIASIGYNATLREINAYFDALDEWSAMPHHLAAGRADHIERMSSESDNPFIKAFLPSLTRARILYERIIAERRATHLIVRLIVYCGKTGRFPRKLGKLDLPDLDELRVDPFSGRNFAYKRKGDSFTLYSIADNLKDDGGKHDPKWENGDFVFWPVQD